MEPEMETKRPESPVMANAAFILGVISMVGLMCVFPAFICAPIGIAVALLSRGANETMSRKAKTGCMLCLAGLIAGVLSLASSCYTIMTDKTTRDYYRSTYQQVYGVDPFEGIPDSFFPGQGE